VHCREESFEIKTSTKRSPMTQLFQKIFEPCRVRGKILKCVANADDACNSFSDPLKWMFDGNPKPGK